MNYTTEMIVRDRMRERLREAADERLARTIPAEPRRPSWPIRLTVVIGRRLAGATEAPSRSPSPCAETR